MIDFQSYVNKPVEDLRKALSALGSSAPFVTFLADYDNFDSLPTTTTFVRILYDYSTNVIKRVL